MLVLYIDNDMGVFLFCQISILKLQIMCYRSIQPILAPSPNILYRKYMLANLVVLKGNKVGDRRAEMLGFCCVADCPFGAGMNTSQFILLVVACHGVLGSGRLFIPKASVKT